MTMATMDAPLLSPAEAARILGCSRWWVTREIASGRLHAYQLGRGQGKGRMLRLDARDIAALARTDEPDEAA
jgi:excisionase family DNA binding protein